MQRTQFDDRACSVARTLDIIGEWWTPLILRDIFYGVYRFDAMRNHLGISRKVLTNRLNRLVEHQIVKRVPYQDNPPRYEYRLTERGKELFPVIVTLMTWGDKWLHEEDGAPVELIERETEEVVRPVLVSAETGRELRYGDVRVRPGAPAHKEAWQALQQAIAESRT